MMMRAPCHDALLIQCAYSFSWRVSLAKLVATFSEQMAGAISARWRSLMACSASLFMMDMSILVLFLICSPFFGK
jgi:hypothetical protein